VQTQLREENGGSLGKEEKQNRRAKYHRAQWGFKLTTRDKQRRTKATASLAGRF